MNMLTVEQIQKAVPKAPLPWVEAIVKHCPKYGIDTPHEIASFLAQTIHESSNFKRLSENLNYSSQRLMQVWPKRFPNTNSTLGVMHNPEALANRVYAKRMGNGDEASGDGWKFRGRGPIQLTGKNNYTSFATRSGIDVLTDPDLLLTPDVGIESACWFWEVNKLDKYDDDVDARTESKLINGGELGIKERQLLLTQIAKDLDVT